MIRFKLDLSELVRLIFAVEHPHLLYHRGKAFTILQTDNVTVLFYAETKREGFFIRYDVLRGWMEWVSHVEKVSDVVYIPVIKIDEVEGLEFK